MTTHMQHIAKVKPARPCTQHDINFGGECFNCGWQPPRPASPAEIDATDAPAGYFARAQTRKEMWPTDAPSCDGCAFQDEPAEANGLRCSGRNCSPHGRKDKRNVIFQRIA